MTTLEIVKFFGVGMTVWFMTWGLNRVYLTFKKFVS